MEIVVRYSVIFVDPGLQMDETLLLLHPRQNHFANPFIFAKLFQVDIEHIGHACYQQFVATFLWRPSQFIMYADCFFFSQGVTCNVRCISSDAVVRTERVTFNDAKAVDDRVHYDV